MEAKEKKEAVLEEKEERSLTLTDYVNMARRASLFMIGPIEGIKNTEDLEQEYNRIMKKESNFSRKRRGQILAIYEAAKLAYQRDTESSSREEYNKIESSLAKAEKLALDMYNASQRELIAKEYVTCAKDPVYFMKKYCYIQHPMRGRIL